MVVDGAVVVDEAVVAGLIGSVVDVLVVAGLSVVTPCTAISAGWVLQAATMSETTAPATESALRQCGITGAERRSFAHDVAVGPVDLSRKTGTQRQQRGSSGAIW